MASATTDPDVFHDLIRRTPVLEALRGTKLDRRELEERLGISRATSHRCTKSLGELGLVERLDGEFTLTESGEAVTAAVLEFESVVETALRLEPVLAATRDTVPAFPLAAFADATVTSAERGDSYSPMNRFISLVRETETLRGLDVESVAPAYVDEFQQRILDGMETEQIGLPEVAENIMESYPEKCVQVCVSGHLTLWLHDDVPFSLVIFDDRVAIGVRYPNTRTLRLFVDTDAPDAREWAESVYESYRARAVPLEEFTKRGLREAREARTQ